jgi:hypothetical protein
VSLVCKVRVSLCVSCMSSEGLAVCILHVSGGSRCVSFVCKVRVWPCISCM